MWEEMGGGGGEGGARVAIDNDSWRPLCLVEVC